MQKTENGRSILSNTTVACLAFRFARNPTGWLKTAAFREGLAPPDSAPRFKQVIAEQVYRKVLSEAPATPRWTSGDDGKVTLQRTNYLSCGGCLLVS